MNKETMYEHDTMFYRMYENRKNVLIFFVCILAILYSVMYIKSTQTPYISSQQNLSADLVANDDAVKLLEEVSTHILLPDETPDIATIEDAAALKEMKAFFDTSENGDRVLFYQDRVIVYRPSIHKIVKVGPILIDNSVQTQPGNIQLDFPVYEVTLEVRNGSETPGLAGTVAERIGASDLYTISDVTNAVGSYENTVLVRNTDKDIRFVEYDFQLLSTKMPAGEAASSADLVLILGNDVVLADTPQAE